MNKGKSISRKKSLFSKGSTRKNLMAKPESSTQKKVLHKKRSKPKKKFSIDDDIESTIKSALLSKGKVEYVSEDEESQDEEQKVPQTKEEETDEFAIESEDSKKLNWNDMGIDKRIQRTIQKLKFDKPTEVQRRLVPKALEGRDILAKAVTGSGKTFAFVVPAIQCVLDEKNRKDIIQEIDDNDSDKGNDDSSSDISASDQCFAKVLCIVPSYELAEQVYEQFEKLNSLCKDECSCIFLGSEDEEKLESRLNKLSQNPDIIIGTPNQVRYSLDYQEFSLKKLKMFIIDESDLVMKKHFSELKRIILSYCPSYFQSIMTSATLNTSSIGVLQEQLLKDPVKLDCREKNSELRQFSYYISGNMNLEVEEILSVFSIAYYALAGGKMIVYTKDERKMFRVIKTLRKLGLKGISCISSYIPIVSRYDIIDQFNKGKIRVLFATNNSLDEASKNLDTSEVKNFRIGNADFIEKYINTTKSLEISTEEVDKLQSERGIDFKDVAAVINMEVPDTLESYVHRIGRTARGGKAGLSITFVTSSTKKIWDLFEPALEEFYESEILSYKGIDSSDVSRLMYRCASVYDEAKLNWKIEAQSFIKKELKNAQKINTNSNRNDVSHSFEENNFEENELPEYLLLDSVQKDAFLRRSGILNENKTLAYKLKESVDLMLDEGVHNSLKDEDEIVKENDEMMTKINEDGEEVMEFDASKMKNMFANFDESSMMIDPLQMMEPSMQKSTKQISKKLENNDNQSLNRKRLNKKDSKILKSNKMMESIQLRGKTNRRKDVTEQKKERVQNIRKILNKQTKQGKWTNKI